MANRSSNPRTLALRRTPLAASLVLCLSACDRDQPASDGVTLPDAGGPSPTADAGQEPPAPIDPGPTRVCSASAWCWDSPGVQGNTLNGVFVRAADDVWAVGDLGLVLHFDGDAWTRHDVPTEEKLTGVWASSDEVWVVGAKSTVLARQDDTWSAVSIPALGDERALASVWGAQGNLWIAGGENTLIERRGGAWSAVTLEGVSAYNAIWAGGSEVWAVGNAGVVAHYVDGAWARVDLGTAADLLRVDGSGSAVWISGAGGFVRRWDGDAWLNPTGEGAPAGVLGALWVSSEDEVYVGNAAGSVYVWDGDAACPPVDGGIPEESCPTWSARATGEALGIRALSGRGNFSTAVGDFGTIVSWQGEVRSVWSRGSLDNYLDVSGSGDAVWIGGDRLLSRVADTWQEVERDGVRAVYALSALPDGQALIAGTGGMARRYKDDDWQSMDVRADAWLRGVWSDGNRGWLVGSRGGSWGLLNNSLWTPLTTPTQNDLLAVWTAPDDNAWAVGAGGIILRHDGIGWAQIPSGPEGGVDADLRDVWGSSGDDIWAVGTGGSALRWDGEVWQNQNEPASYSLNGVWGSAKDDVWAVGSGGTILHFDGSSWLVEESGTRHALNSVWGNAERVWVVGEHGTVLIKERAPVSAP
jgi:hypothetical protein